MSDLRDTTTRLTEPKLYGNAEAVGGGSGTPADSVTSETNPGQGANAGAASTYSRGDHTHGTPPLPTPAAIGASPVGHTHPSSDVTGLPQPATTVVSETNIGQIPAVGVSTDYARADHTHGTPAAGANVGAPPVPKNLALGYVRQVVVRSDATYTVTDKPLALSWTLDAFNYYDGILFRVWNDNLGAAHAWGDAGYVEFVLDHNGDPGYSGPSIKKGEVGGGFSYEQASEYLGDAGIKFNLISYAGVDLTVLARTRSTDGTLSTTAAVVNRGTYMSNPGAVPSRKLVLRDGTAIPATNSILAWDAANDDVQFLGPPLPVAYGGTGFESIVDFIAEWSLATLSGTITDGQFVIGTGTSALAGAKMFQKAEGTFIYPHYVDDYTNTGLAVSVNEATSTVMLSAAAARGMISDNPAIFAISAANIGGSATFTLDAGGIQLKAHGLVFDGVIEVTSGRVDITASDRCTLNGEQIVTRAEMLGSNIGNTPAGNIAATDVQAAINELDSEKAPVSHTQAATTITLSATDKIVGRASAGAGAAEEIACTAAGRALIDDADAATQRTTLGLGDAAVATVVSIRQIPQVTKTADYTLTTSEIGKHVSTTHASQTNGITVAASVFSAGDAITIYNDNSTNLTITQGSSVTMYLGGTATTGNRTLAQRGIATILCVASNTFVISGAGLT